MKKLIVQNVEAGIVPLPVKVVEAMLTMTHEEIMVTLAHVVVESKIGYVEELKKCGLVPERSTRFNRVPKLNELAEALLLFR